MVAGLDSTAVCGIAARCVGLAEALAHDHAIAQAGRLVSALALDPRADGGEVLWASSKGHHHHQVITPTEECRRKRRGEGCSGGKAASIVPSGCSRLRLSAVRRNAPKTHCGAVMIRMRAASVIARAALPSQSS